MIARVWRGWTKPEDGDVYERLLRETVFPAIRGRIDGFRAGYVMRRDVGGEAEFLVMTVFDSLTAVRRFAGDDYEEPVIEPEAARLLTRRELQAAHYVVIIDRP